MADPSNVLALDDLKLMTGYEVRPVVSSREDIASLIAEDEPPRRRRRRGSIDEPTRTTRSTTSREVARGPRRRRAGHQARQLDHRPGDRGRRLRHPLRAGEDRDMRVRFRIDGVLHEPRRSRAAWSPGVVSRVKIMGDLDIAERRVPQDGRISSRVDGQQDRHPRRHAADAPTARASSCASSTRSRSLLTLDALGMLPRGARALRARLPPVLRRGARHRPDRLGQVDHALRGAQRAQHDREEHHHDRGPGRVPARRRQPGAGQPARPA